MLIRGALLLAIACLVATTAQAAPHRGLACPAPKPLPAGVKKPPQGASATELANFLLALPQRKPCDVNLFTSRYQAADTVTPGFYPEGAPMAPAAGVALTEARVRSQLKSLLKGSAGAASAMALFDSPRVRARVPDAPLRGALALARMTVAQPVVDWFVSSSDVIVRYGGAPLGVVAAVGPGQIVFNRRHAADHFALQSATLTHEILHLVPDQRTLPSPTEEVILHAVGATVHLQLLARRPELATVGTELARQRNDEALIFVNSRIPGSSKSAIIAPGGRGTALGSAKSRRDLYEHASQFNLNGRAANPGDSAVAPAPFAQLLRKLLERGVKVPKPLTYSKKTALLFSRMNDSWLSPVDRLRASVLLRLVSMEEITAYTGLSRQKAITTFKLAPILAVQ
jgi:hypothetical protein